MKEATSLYLDIIRFTAAVTVFLYHFSFGNFSGGLFWQIRPYAPEAVIVFFVLSGFVIAYVCDTRERSARGYATARAARIYSVALPALILTYTLDSIGSAFRPDLYQWVNVGEGRFSGFGASILFLHQIWSLDLVPGSDLPYWSLGYEVWYYILFGAGLFFPRQWRAVGICGGLLIVGINIAVFFPVWLFGVLAYKVSQGYMIRALSGALLCVGSLIGWVTYQIIVLYFGNVATEFMPDVLRKPVIQYYVIGLLFAAHLVGFDSICHVATRILRPMSAIIRWLAGATFSIYLFHYPIAKFILTVDPWPISSWESRAMVLAGTIIGVFALAEMTERRKGIWIKFFRQVFMYLEILLRGRVPIQYSRKEE